MLTLLAGQNGDRNLAAIATVFDLTPAAAAILRVAIELGDGDKDLDGSGGAFQFVIAVEGRRCVGPDASRTIELPASTEQARVEFTVLVPAGQQITILVTSPNAADDDVDVTARAYDLSGVSNGLGGELATAAELAKVPRRGETFKHRNTATNEQATVVIESP